MIFFCPERLSDFVCLLLGFGLLFFILVSFLIFVSFFRLDVSLLGKGSGDFLGTFWGLWGFPGDSGDFPSTFATMHTFG